MPRSSLPLCRALLGAALLSLSSILSAQSWTEVDAGELPRSAETTRGVHVLNRIDGTLASGNDVDMFVIRVDDPSTFSCTAVGGATWDTQLFLFTLDGLGVAFHDDVSSTVRQSTLTGALLPGPGRYLLAISRYDNDPVDAFGNELWLDQSFYLERSPDGPGAFHPVDHWVGSASPAGGYSLCLSGASVALMQPDEEPVVAWARVSHSLTVDPRWSHTPSGLPVTVESLGVGLARVDFPDCGPSTGVVHVTPVDGPHHAIVNSWSQTGSTVNVYVRMLDVSGTPTNAPFDVMFRRGGSNERREAYLWADDSANPGPYHPSAVYAWNGARPPASITHTPGSGVYTVLIPGLGTAGPERGHVQVSPYLGGLTSIRRAQVSSWNSAGPDLAVTVRTFDGFGNPSDGRFTLSYNEVAAPIPAHLGSGAHVWANNALPVAPYVPEPLYTDSNGTFAAPGGETVSRTAAGLYLVHLPDVAPEHSAIALATVYGSTAAHASVRDWYSDGASGTVVEVEIFAPGQSVRSSSRFTLLYLTNRPAGIPGTNTVIGGGCGTCTAGVPGGPIVLQGLTRPVVGRNWEVRASNIPAGAIAFQLIGFSDPNLPLDIVLGPSWACQVLHASPDLVQAGSLSPPSSQDFVISIPGSPVLLGAFLFQQDMAFMAAGGLVSNGIRGFVGDV